MTQDATRKDLEATLRSLKSLGTYGAAQMAWDDGHRHHLARLNVADPDFRTVGVQLDKIEAIGWHLHTWQVTPEEWGYALFVRPE